MGGIGSILNQVTHAISGGAKAIGDFYTQDIVKPIFGYDSRNGSWGNKDSLIGGAFNLGSSGQLNFLPNAIGYNPSNGKWGDKGSDVDWFNEGIGQINGSNAARHAAGVASDAVNVAAAKQNLLLSQEREQNRLADINASNGASAIRNTSQQQQQTSSIFSASSYRPVGSQLGSSGQDFLGL